ncbi:hypothetical protein [Piscinibacter koreensis]|uniref:Uncharacterized protein n=1 Tax=Piscinibacter koreensis TaxID=2742824 RepID=A0A7Y6NQU7_9BURK|nr:hypothetical protein [Schlegelella koreensis]NUZ07660.1 hypothetical protein [Schlegelella koreensis]
MSPALIPVLVLVASAAVCRWGGVTVTVAEPGALLTVGGTVASVSATMLGFLLAALAVLASINHTHLVRMMRQTGHYKDLLHTVFASCATFLLCLLLGFTLALGFEIPGWTRGAIVPAHLAALASLVDVGRKFWLVLCNLREA